MFILSVNVIHSLFTVNTTYILWKKERSFYFHFVLQNFLKFLQNFTTFSNHATTSNRHFRTRNLKIKQIFVRLIGAHRRSGVDLVQTDVW